MDGPLLIEPTAIYDDGALRLALGITSSTLTTARSSGALRFTRKGKRVFYLGEWILAWLRDSEVKIGRAEAREVALP